MNTALKRKKKGKKKRVTDKIWMMNFWDVTCSLVWGNWWIWLAGWCHLWEILFNCFWKLIILVGRIVCSNNSDRNSFYLLSFFFFVFLGLYPQHMEVPRLGVESELQLWPTPEPQPQPHWIQATSSTYTTAHGNAGSLIHWAKSGIQPATL